MKNLIPLTIVSLLLLSSCGALETTNPLEANRFQNSSEFHPCQNFSNEEYYWLLTDDINSPLFSDPFWSLRMRHRSLAENCVNGNRRTYSFHNHPKYGVDNDH